MCNKKQLILAKCFDKKDNLISSAYNSYTKTHPVQKYFATKVHQPFRDKLHAEILAILRAKGKKIYKITVERYNQAGEKLLAKPCPICEEAIRAYGISVVEFTE